jgi:hypothetical protein
VRSNADRGLQDNLDSDEELAPSLTDALEARGIHYQLPYMRKERALRALGGVTPLPEAIERERLMRGLSVEGLAIIPR